MLVCPTLLLWVAVLNNNMVKIKYARPKILAGHLVGSRRPKMARGPQFGNHWRKHTHTYPFNSPFSRTTQVSQCQKGKTSLDFTEARDSEWQWHQLGHMQVCTLLQTDNHTSTPPLCVYRPDDLPATQPTVSKH